MTRAARGNLPPELTSFVGRRRELAQIASLYAKTRVLTVTGPGGVGKSRVALVSASRRSPALAAGGWLVELARIRDGRLVPDAVADALGVVGREGEPVEKAIVERLRPAPALLVLDNCEHVLASCRTLLNELLYACPSLRVLATSRQPLGVAGEVTLALAPLDVPRHVDGTASPRELLRFDAVALFTQRAQAADPNFELTGENAQQVVEICRRVAGMPLGLELAAVRVRGLPLSALVQRLDDQLSLTNPAVDDDPRHATLTSTLDVSHDLIDEPEQMLWRRLSIFAGGFSIDSATRVAAGDGLQPAAITDLLASLVERSIVSRVVNGDPERFRLLEPIRLYGREKLRVAGEERAMVLRHRAWCAELAAGKGPWWTGVDQLAWVHRLNAEQAEIHAALDVLLHEPDGTEAGLELVADAWAAFVVQDRYRGIGRYLAALLERDSPPTVARAQALHAAAYIAITGSDFAAAGVYGAECERLARRHGLKRELGLAGFILGLLALFEFDERAARRGFASALKAFEKAETPIIHAAVLNLIGHYSEAPPDSAECRRLIDESLARLGATDDLWMTSMCQQRQGRLGWMAGDWEAGETYNCLALRLQRDLGYRFGIAYTIDELAWLAVSTNEPERAAQLLGAAETLMRELAASLPVRAVEWHGSAVAGAQAALGETRYAAHYALGVSYDAATAVAVALRERDPASDPGVPGEEWELLTPRERQVAELVARGDSNPDIAAALLITRHTVKTHVQHIMAKLGVDTRTDIAVWVTERR